MKKRIFYSIFGVTTAVLLAAFIIIMMVMYNHFTTEQLEQLRNEMKLVKRGVALEGDLYFKGLTTTDFRITWIDSDGEILYENKADPYAMQNHLEREEVQKAIKEGYGESKRYSSTLSEQQLFIAEKLEDGTILRLSTTMASIWSLFLRFSVFPITIIVLAMAASLAFASRLSKHIVDPLISLDLDDPLSGRMTSYEEVYPLLQRLHFQHEQIEKDRKELEKTTLIRQEFTANASHELKTPLHVISGYAELLENGLIKEEEIPVFAKKIGDETRRMTKLADDILNLSKLDSGAIDMRREKLDLYLYASQVIDELSSIIDENGTDLSLEGSHVIIEGIPDAINSIIYNLVTNAIKYSGQRGKVTISVKEDGDKAVLEVKDNGIGIGEDDLERIFERFYRVDKSRSKELGGTGLGLSIVKHSARIHDAQVTVKSKLGEGSVFTVIFPKA